jgi:uncharacterized membrane protein YgdD (TMEM256/DUF423 family)
MNKRFTLLTGTVLAGLAVAFGAFGSHALKAMLTQHGRTDTFETAVRYQMYHALALLLIGSLMKSETEKKASLAAGFFLTGTILFSGSLYLLCLYPIPGVVYLTPVGGVLFMTGWIFLLLYFWSNKKTV